MHYPHITKLYMYKPPNCYTLDILRKYHLWAAKPERFNDPFDCDLENFSRHNGRCYVGSQCNQNRDSESAIAHYKASKLDADGKFIPEERKRVDNLTPRAY